ncbi:MAG: hypothetical protein KGP12_04165 [Actinomycetales bacterium]|nr:hypothetical protein [Actinomycetales bacterium]
MMSIQSGARLREVPARDRGMGVVPLAACELMASARRSLTEATLAGTPHERYASAHLSALRAAAAVLAARSCPQGKRRARVRSVWAVLPETAAEFSEWAAFFAAGARKRASAEAGIPCVTHREADDLVRDADAFIARVSAFLGLPHQSMLIAGLRHTG